MLSKKFTVKDFVLYNTPCFSCGGKVIVKLINEYQGAFSEFASFDIIKDELIANLKTKYNSSNKLSISINVTNNKYSIESSKSFSEYLETHRIHLVNKCLRCNSFIVTEPLEFDDIGFVKAIYLKREILKAYYNQSEYDLFTEFKNNETQVCIYKKDRSYLNIKLPLFPLYKFKNRENLLKKLKIYTVFS